MVVGRGGRVCGRACPGVRSTGVARSGAGGPGALVPAARPLEPHPQH